MDQSWRITLFGTLRVQQADRVLTRFKYQKVGGLLAYLAYQPRQMHSREVLVEIFWPESTPEAGRAASGGRDAPKWEWNERKS